jgi:hypothetical protein
MSIRQTTLRAEKILRHWPPGARPLLTGLCREIREAERGLNAAAALNLEGCLKGCRGLCCRNLDLGAVLGLEDFLYILCLEPGLKGAIAACTLREAPLFSADCLFLERGRGPCRFPPDLRPEVCITTFCRGEAAVKAEILRVRRGFRRLGRLRRLRRLPHARLLGWLAGVRG